MELEYQGQSSTSKTTNKEKQVVIIDDNKNENDILPEFGEFLMNRDYIDGDTNVNKIELNVTDTFKDWNEVDIIVNRYAKQNGFVTIKSRKDLDAIDKTIVRRCVYTCWKSGIHKPKKAEQINLHRDAVTTKMNCPWQVSFYFGKHATVIHLTKFDNIHNHQCDPVTIEFATKNQRFPQIILNKIEHYTTNGHLSAGQQYDLLLKEFPQHNIKKKTLYNAIQKF